MANVNSGIKRQYWSICWPAALEGLLIVLLSSVDLVMVSSLGTEAVAAVGIFSQPKMAMLCVSRSLSVVVTIIVARKYGNGEINQMSVFLKQMTVITAGCSLILFICSEIFMKQILFIAGAEELYIDEAMHYAVFANIYLLFFGPSIVINAGLTGIGQTRPLLVSNVTGNLVNAGLNAVFLYVMNWGVAGAGFATAVGGAVTLFCAFVFTLNKESPITLAGFHDWKPERKTFRVISTIFPSVFLEQIFERVGMFLYYVMTARLGMIDFAVHNICMTLCDIFYNFSQGFAKSSLSLSSRLLSCENTEKRKTFFKMACYLPMSWAIVAAFLYITAAEGMMQWFTDDAEIIRKGVCILHLVALCSVPEALALSMAGVVRGMGGADYVARYSFWSIAVMRPIVTWVLCFVIELGLLGAWISLTMDQTVRWIFAYRYARKFKSI